MFIFYYSYARNTDRFVRKHLMPQFPDAWVGKLIAKGPHEDLQDVENIREGVLREGKPDIVLWVTPTYGRFNHQKGHAEDYTPLPVSQAMLDWVRDPAKQYILVGGNRTFGRDFARQDAIPANIVKVGEFELAGSAHVAHQAATTIQLDNL